MKKKQINAKAPRRQGAKRMKPVKAWAIVSEYGYIDRSDPSRGAVRPAVYMIVDEAIECRGENQRIVPVEIREGLE